jgi:hypothetical protein
MNRREFNKLALAGTAGAAFGLAGCDPIQEIITWEPTAVDAINGIESILEVNGISFSPTITLALNLLKASLVDLLAACQEYEATTPPPVGTLQKIKTFVQDVINNFGSFLNALGLPDGNLLNLILSLVQVVLSVITGLFNELPAASTTKIVATNLKAGRTTIPIVPANNPTVVSFKNSWNQTCKATAGNLTIPSYVYMKVSFWHDRMHL